MAPAMDAAWLASDARAPALDASEAVLSRALAAGLNFKLSMGNVSTLTPPLTITSVEMDAALDILDDVIADTAARR